MRSAIAALALPLALLLLAPGSAAAQVGDAGVARVDGAAKKEIPRCVCAPQDLKTRSTAQHVFIGKVASRNDNPKDEGERMESKAEFLFEDVEWLRGELPAPVLVRTFKISCSTTFEIGETYVVFSNRNEPGQMTASFCSGNRVATPEIVAKIKKILPPAGASETPDGKGDGEPAGSKAGGASGKTSASADGGSGAAAKPRGSWGVLIAVGLAGLALLGLLAFRLRKKKDDERDDERGEE